jgi:UDP-2,3-diacylglucosamine pyrophosphatase LpxH
MNDAIIISDIHLGSDVCQSKKLIDFLRLIENDQILTKEIIINGDLFDSWDFRKLKGSHWKVLSSIRSLSKTKHIVWINGNHDGPAEIISHLIGVDFVEEYKIKSGDKNILILHGDIFDNFISKYPMFTKFADKIYRLIQFQ